VRNESGTNGRGSTPLAIILRLTMPGEIIIILILGIIGMIIAIKIKRKTIRKRAIGEISIIQM
jgi:hypothetical protein